MVALIEGRRQRRELRDKVGQVVSSHYWPAEADVSRLLRDVETMRGAELFRDVSAFDVLAFKYRFRRPLVADDPAPLNPGPARPPNALQTLRRVERLLDSLALQVRIAYFMYGAARPMSSHAAILSRDKVAACDVPLRAATSSRA